MGCFQQVFLQAYLLDQNVAFRPSAKTLVSLFILSLTVWPEGREWLLPGQRGVAVETHGQIFSVVCVARTFSLLQLSRSVCRIPVP